MPELRLNLVTREWVVIATERAKRPEDFKAAVPERPAMPPYLAECPFCPGNEGKTTEERFRISEGDAWKIRVVANKYPAVASVGEKHWIPDGFRRTVTGVGLHDVIIESPAHNMNPALMEPGHVNDLIGVYRKRFIEAHRDPRVEHVIIFRNHGEGAGTSLAHPHSQIIGVPVVPVQFRDRVQAAMHFFDNTGECLFCHILNKEKGYGVRVVLETEHFLTFIPYAALSPFHTWVFPKRHSAVFSDISDEEAADLALNLKTVLSKFYWGLDNPDYNLVIRSSRPEDAKNEYCHWYLSIVPRVTQSAGFELGSGMFINTGLPEESARFLRGAPVE